jgi:hypothetical protein
MIAFGTSGHVSAGARMGGRFLEGGGGLLSQRPCVKPTEPQWRQGCSASSTVTNSSAYSAYLALSALLPTFRRFAR